jgi:biopolymer transport protein ExbB/TolQ
MHYLLSIIVSLFLIISVVYLYNDNKALNNERLYSLENENIQLLRSKEELENTNNILASNNNQLHNLNNELTNENNQLLEYNNQLLHSQTVNNQIENNNQLLHNQIENNNNTGIIIAIIIIVLTLTLPILYYLYTLHIKNIRKDAINKYISYQNQIVMKNHIKVIDN